MSITSVSAADLEECPECLLGNLNWLLTQAHYALASELAAAFEPVGLTPRSHAVLSAAMSGSFTQKELADLVGLDKTTMVVTLDELEAGGLARRLPSATDRRARLVEATAVGKRRVAQANKVAARVQQDVLASLGADDGATLMDVLADLVQRRLAEPAACKGIRRREPR